MVIPKKFRSHYLTQPKPLGMHLLEADLISSSQIQLALQDQEYYSNLRLGEILALRGWLRQETADFFARDWQTIIKQRRKQPLGFYLRQSGLLTEKDIEIILHEHAQTGIRFGTVAVIQGLLKSTTLDYFLMYLCPKEIAASPFISPKRTTSRQYKPFKPFQPQIAQPKKINYLEDEFTDQFFDEPQIEDVDNSIIWID